MADPQALRLYDMEATFMAAWLRTVRQPLSLLQACADRACRRWRVPLVRIRFGINRTWYGTYFSDRQCVDLYLRPNGASGRNVPVLLHEVAHHIDDCIWNAAEAHGPIFAAIEMDLLDHYGVLPKRAFRKLADKHNVKVARLRKRKPA